MNKILILTPAFLVIIACFVSAEYEDLSFGNFYITPGDELKPTGTPVVIVFILQNNGTEKNNVDYKVDWKDGTIITFTIPTLAANDTTLVNVFHYYTEPAVYTVCITLDPDNDFPEDDETNNVECGITSIYSDYLTTLYDQQTYVGMWGDEEVIVDYLGDDQLTFFGVDFFTSPFFLEIPFEPNREANDLPLVLLALLV